MEKNARTWGPSDTKGTAIIFAGEPKSSVFIRCFDKPRHLLPIANKPLIQYIIESIRDYVKNIIISVRSETEEDKILNQYHKLFDGEKITTWSQIPTGRLGTVATLKDTIESNRSKVTFPILVVYGDTMNRRGFFPKFIKEFDKNGPIDILWALFLRRKDIRYRRKSSEEGIWDEKSECRRYGYVVPRQDMLKESDHTIDGRDIIDILAHPLDIELHIGNQDCLIDMGLYMFSEKGYIKLVNTSLFPLDSARPFLIDHRLKQLLITEETVVKGFICNLEGCWQDINYPWEVITANKWMMKLIAEEGIGSDRSMKTDDTEYIVIRKDNDSNELYKVGFENEKESLESAKYNDIHKNISLESKIDGPIIIPVGDKNVIPKIEELTVIKGPCFFGKGCKIFSQATVYTSSFGNNVEAHLNSFVRDCIIMDDVVISHNTSLANSIIGNFVKLYATTITSANLPRFQYDKNEKVPIPTRPRPIRYLHSTGIVETTENFGALVGNYTIFGSNSNVAPGKIIGANCVIYSGCNIFKDIPNNSIARQYFPGEVQVNVRI